MGGEGKGGDPQGLVDTPMFKILKIPYSGCPFPNNPTPGLSALQLSPLSTIRHLHNFHPESKDTWTACRHCELSLSVYSFIILCTGIAIERM